VALGLPCRVCSADLGGIPFDCRCVTVLSVAETRRHAIGSALLRIVARDGIDGVSLALLARPPGSHPQASSVVWMPLSP
jgi:hypothetical protein